MPRRETERGDQAHRRRPTDRGMRSTNGLVPKTGSAPITIKLTPSVDSAMPTFSHDAKLSVVRMTRTGPPPVSRDSLRQRQVRHVHAEVVHALHLHAVVGDRVHEVVEEDAALHRGIGL